MPSSSKLLDAATDRIAELESAFTAAMQFVPRPEEMSGFDDPDAPDEVQKRIAIAARLHGVHLNESRPQPQELSRE